MTRDLRAWLGASGCVCICVCFCVSVSVCLLYGLGVGFNSMRTIDGRNNILYAAQITCKVSYIFSEARHDTRKAKLKTRGWSTVERQRRGPKMCVREWGEGECSWEYLKYMLMGYTHRCAPSSTGRERACVRLHEKEAKFNPTDFTVPCVCIVFAIYYTYTRITYTYAEYRHARRYINVYTHHLIPGN